MVPVFSICLELLPILINAENNCKKVFCFVDMCYCDNTV